MKSSNTGQRLQAERFASSTSSLRCWRIQTWPTASPGCRHRPASSASPRQTRTRWRRSGAGERATRGPWLTRRCPGRSGTTPGQERSSRWRRSSPTSSVKTPWCHCRKDNREILVADFVHSSHHVIEITESAPALLWYLALISNIVPLMTQMHQQSKSLLLILYKNQWCNRFFFFINWSQNMSVTPLCCAIICLNDNQVGHEPN